MTKSKLLIWTPFLATLILGVILSLLGSIPPFPQSETAPVDEFSSGRAMAHVRVIASKPHPTGSEENADVRAYLLDRLTDLGLEVSVSESEITGRPMDRLNRWNGETKPAQTIYNLVGVLPGQDPDQKALLLMAHHDTVWGSPGASDDTIGLATILETVRVLKLMQDRQRDVIVLFTDAEELGLSGARHFFSEHPLRNKIGAVINFEARGGGGLATMFQTSRGNGEAARLYARHVKQPSTSSLSVFVYNALPNDTDLTPALEKDYTAYNIAHIGRPGFYHSPKITADALDEKSLQHMGSQAVDLARALVVSQKLPGKKPDAVFFDVFGFFTIIYAPVWGWLILFISAVVFGLSVRGSVKLKEIIAGTTKMLVFLLTGAALLYGFNILSGAGQGANYYDRLAAIPKLEFVAIFLCAGVLLLVFGTKAQSTNHRLGMSLPFFVIAILGQIYVPTVIYFISFSLMFCGLSSWLVEIRYPILTARAAVVLLSGSVTGYMFMLGHLLMLGVGPDVLSIAIIPAALVGQALAPIFHALPKTRVRLSALVCLISSLLVALWIRLDPIASTVPVY